MSDLLPHTPTIHSPPHPAVHSCSSNASVIEGESVSTIPSEGLPHLGYDECHSDKCLAYLAKQILWHIISTSLLQ